ncbi:MAG: hypothetical protein ABR507_11490 [Actinomycetota bacterium]|nr:hypothetical protein [Actinomycetota bacterium]
MISIELDQLPVTIADDNVDIRASEVGEMTVGFFRLKAGTDLSPALVGLPGDLCQCPHWGYMLKGRLMMKTKDGDQIFEAGKPFYWAPGHAPVALEDCEYVDFSPTQELAAVVRHIKGE